MVFSISGVFNGPQIKKLLKKEEFVSLLNPVKKGAWKAFVGVIQNFLGNKRSENYQEIVKEMISAYHEMGVNMSLKIHFLHNHLDFFSTKLNDFSDEHGERFHEDIATIETRYRGKDVRLLLAEYCWSLCRDTDPELLNRKNKLQKF